MTKKGTFSRGTNVGNPDRAARVANQNAVFKIRSRIQSRNQKSCNALYVHCVPGAIKPLTTTLILLFAALVPDDLTKK